MEITPIAAVASKSRTSKVHVAASSEPTQSKVPKKAKSVAAPEPTKVSKPRKSAAKAKAVAEPVVTTKPAPEEIGSMIAQAAYYIAAQRNFAPGNEMDDWLNAERDILSRYVP